MRKVLSLAGVFLLGAIGAAVAQVDAPAVGDRPAAQNASPIRQGADAFADWRASKPGVRWFIKPVDLPQPYDTPSAFNSPDVVPRPEGAVPQAPEGYKVTLFASGLAGPRKLAVAPNGDVFVAESGAGAVRVLRSDDSGASPSSEIFASGLSRPYGIAFFPSDNPQYVYVAETNRVVRFAYRTGDMKAAGAPEVIVDGLPTGGHWTRDIAFAPDGSALYISVGSRSNVAEGLPRRDVADLQAYEETNGIGAAWGAEEGRATVLVADPDGKNVRRYANGIRNCSGLAIEPTTGSPWCVTNERDGLGDNLPPDYATRVQQGAFYGWPWYFIGGREDPRHKGARPDLLKYVVEPDVLIQAHSAPLGIVFYQGTMFPELVGSPIVTLHGSWNRGKRTGYKVVRLIMDGGQPTGAYEDLLTGFVISDGDVWGRPVGVAVAPDGSILVSEDGNDTIWRISR
jgi:glucose/arabinose dehydrogenase